MKKFKIKSIIYKNIALIAISAMIFINYLVAIAPDRSDDKLSKLSEDKAMPPSLTLITVALGPIRGLIADALWWHVSELQEKSEYFEIIKITDWITAMQPKNSFVWTYHAWNLAYNIANEFPTNETRWEWINNGIKLLRNEGLEYNPNSNFIKNELGWILVDRVSGLTDRQYRFYVKQWALGMGKYMHYGNRTEIERMLLVLSDNRDIGEDESVEKKLIYKFEKNMKLEPKRMLFIDKKYGPFNWLLPQASAVYWSARDNMEGYIQGDLMNYKSVVPAAMQQSFTRGSIVEHPPTDLFITTNDFRIVANIINLYATRALSSKRPRQEKASMLRFARNAIPILHSFGEKDKAQLLFKEYKRLRSDIDVTFENFIFHQLKRFKEDAPARYKQSTIEIYLYNAYYALLENNKIESDKFLEIAKVERDKHQLIYASDPSNLLPIDQLKIAAFCKLYFFSNVKARKELLKLVNNSDIGKLYIESPEKIRYNNVIITDIGHENKSK